MPEPYFVNAKEKVRFCLGTRQQQEQEALQLCSTGILGIATKGGGAQFGERQARQFLHRFSEHFILVWNGCILCFLRKQHAA